VKCDRCNINQATHHLKKSVNGVVSEKYLCSSCAAEENIPFKLFTGGGPIFPPLSFNAFPPDGLLSDETPACNACGTTLLEFNETSLLGCPRCYDELRPYLEPVIKKLHGTAQHNGKAPQFKKSSASPADTRAAERARLVRQLERAVSEEEFEEAARLRDLIRTIDSGGGAK